MGHEIEDRTFIFVPHLNEDQVKSTASRDLLERVFSGSVGSLVAYLLKHETLSRAELDELRQLIDGKRKD